MPNSAHDLETALRLVGSERRAKLVAIPKTDLHAHGLLSASRADLERIAGEPIDPTAEFSGFDHFQHHLRARLVPHMEGPDRIGALLRAALLRMIAEGVVYTELSIDVRLPGFSGVPAQDFAVMLEEIRRELSDRIAICFEGGLHREVPLEVLEPALEELLLTGCLGSIDLYGDERRGSPGDFRELYRRAGERGLKLKAHAGELCGADRIRETVLSLGVHAIQHGIRAVEDPRLVDLLVERRIVLHVCPTSNVRLGLVRDLRSHPIRALVERGVAVTVNTDNYLVFGVDVCDELANLHDEVGLDAAAIAGIVARGLEEAPTSVRMQTR